MVVQPDCHPGGFTPRSRMVFAMNDSMSADSSATATGGGSPSVGVGDWQALDPVVLGFVALAGLVLLLAGGRILRPAVILAIVAVGAWLGLGLATGTREGSLPPWFLGFGVPPIVWVVALPLIMGLVSIFIARFMLAVLLGFAAGTVVLVLGLAVVGGGEVADPAASVPAFWRQAEPAPADPLSETLEDQVAASVQEHLGRMADDFVDDVSEAAPQVPGWIRTWWREATAGLPSGTVELVVALASISAFCVLLLAMLLPDRMAILATAIVGAWLVSVAGASLWVWFDGGSSPPPPLPMLLAGVVLTIVGMAVQFRANPERAKRAPAT